MYRASAARETASEGARPDANGRPDASVDTVANNDQDTSKAASSAEEEEEQRTVHARQNSPPASETPMEELPAQENRASSGEAPSGLALSHLSTPMTYSQMTETGYGQLMPNMLWVPYMAASGPEASDSMGSSLSGSRPCGERADSHKRQLSNHSEASPGREKKTRDQDAEPEDEGDKADTPWLSPRESMHRTAPITQGWDFIPEAIMHIVFEQLDNRAQQNCRLVSKYWLQMMNNNLKAVQPSKARMIHVIQTKFRQLTHLDFTRFEQLRNRNLHTLAESNTKIQELIIGPILQGAYSKPRVTNKGLEYLAPMKSLRSLTFSDCNAFTNSGLSQLVALTNLEELRFIRCTRISEKGMGFLQKLPNLKSLTDRKSTL